MATPQRRGMHLEDVHMLDALPSNENAVDTVDATPVPAPIAAPSAQATVSNSAASASASPLPTTTPELYKYIENRMKPTINLFILRCKLDANGNVNPKKAPLTAEETQYIVNHCEGLTTAPMLSADQLSALNLKATLLAITPRSEVRPTRFPVAAQEAAEGAYAHFDSKRWSAPGELDVSGSESPPSADALAPSHRSRRDSSMSGIAGPSHQRRPSAPLEAQRTGVSTRAPRSHSIYGDQGIMHGIEITRGKTTTYKVHTYSGNDFRVFGHNRVTPGQWWPMQICANRDGAHGARVAGMSYTSEDGVRSVVVNSHYEETDDDRGETIWYSMPGSIEHNDANALKDDRPAEALRLTQTLGKPIRVIRGSGAGWPGRPVVGLRYDGLYQVNGEETRYNSKGGRYVRFRLQRMQGGQTPLAAVTARPNTQERLDEAEVKKGYY